MLKAGESLSDLSFVVENRSRNEGWLFAYGEGRKVLGSLMRLAIMNAARGGATEIGHGFTEVDTDIYTDYWSGIDESGPIAVRDQGRTMNNLMPNGYPYHPAWAGVQKNSRHENYHQNLALEQVRNGFRSPQEVLDEIRQRRSDKQVAWDLSSRWFDLGGRKLLPTGNLGSVEGDESDINRLHLKEIDRRKVASQELQAAKDVLFDQIPSDERAYSVDFVEFHPRLVRFIEGSMSDFRLRPPSTPFIGRGMVMHRQLGYIDSDSCDFIPVTTLRS